MRVRVRGVACPKKTRVCGYFVVARENFKILSTKLNSLNLGKATFTPLASAAYTHNTHERICLFVWLIFCSRFAL